MRYSISPEGPFQEVPLLQGVPCLPVEVEPGSGVLGFFLECQPLWGAITVSAPWVRVAPSDASAGQPGGYFRLLVNPEAAGGPGQYLAQVDLGGQALAVVLQIRSAPVGVVPPGFGQHFAAQPQVAQGLAPGASPSPEAVPASPGGRGRWGLVAAGLVAVCLLGFGLASWWARPTLPPGVMSLGPNAQGVQEYRNEKDGSVLVRVPAGSFAMGADDSDADADEKPVHQVTIDEYFIGKYEVTNEQFERFVSATGYDAGSSWKDYSGQWGSKAPVVCVSWDDAKAYCDWAGGRLPTEAEWEKAARGTDGWKYPWGNEPPEGRAWFSENSGDRAHDVGSAPMGASPYGCLDMAGNVWEWCQDWYDRYPGNTEMNDGYGTKHRVLRGGCWIGSAGLLRSSCRVRSLPDLRYDDLGFRVVWSSLPGPPGP